MPDIVLWTRNPQRLAAWSDLLAEAHLASAVATERPTAAAGIVLTDEPSLAGDLHPPLPPTAVWIVVGTATSPQLSGQQIELPADATKREVLLACRFAQQLFQLQRQVHAEQAARETWAAAALTDTLTGLPNRRAWNDWLHQWEQLTLPERGNVCVAIFDIDHFKPHNDQQGHAAGDTVLTAVAARLRSAVRRSDQVARLGGDEFGVWLPGVTATVAGPLVERLRLAAGNSLITLSAGWAVSSTTTPVPLDQLLESADQALRTAKQTRNCTRSIPQTR